MPEPENQQSVDQGNVEDWPNPNAPISNLAVMEFRFYPGDSNVYLNFEGGKKASIQNGSETLWERACFR
jgi:hypothetical protein